MPYISFLLNLGANTIDIAYSNLEKDWGLISRNSISCGEGLIIDPCNTIHMYFMRFPIDVLFVNKNNQVVYILENFKPWQVSRRIEESKYVIELPVDTIQNSNTHIGDKIKVYEW